MFIFWPEIGLRPDLIGCLFLFCFVFVFYMFDGGFTLKLFYILTWEEHWTFIYIFSEPNLAVYICLFILVL